MTDRYTSIIYASSFTAFIGSLSLHDWLAIGGLCIAASTFFINLFYKIREDKRKEIIFQREIKKLNEMENE